jgi:hypothetical protein
MTIRCWGYSLAVSTVFVFSSMQTKAQCLPLQVLQQSLATRHIMPDSIDNLLSTQGWVRHYSPTPYWTPQTSKPISPKNQPEAWVELRRTNKQSSYDLIYKTTRYACISQLRNELQHIISMRSESVNCIRCEAERLVGYNYTITIFNQKDSYMAKRTAFPYVLIIRRTVAETVEENLVPEVSSQLTDKP